MKTGALTAVDDLPSSESSGQYNSIWKPLALHNRDTDNEKA